MQGADLALLALLFLRCFLPFRHGVSPCWLVDGRWPDPHPTGKLPRLRSSRRGSSALARDCCWRQPDLPPSKRRHETAERTRTSREDGTYNPSCRYRPLKVISFVSSLDAICGVNRNVRESLRTLNKQIFEKFFNHFRRTHPRRVEFGACKRRRARVDGACAAIVRARAAEIRVVPRIIRTRRRLGASSRDRVAKFWAAFAASDRRRAVCASRPSAAGGGRPPRAGRDAGGLQNIVY